MKTRIISEGRVRIKVPLPDDFSYFPNSAAVFYNPEMELNRDITVASISGYIKRKRLETKSVSYVDAMAATGVRGIRIASEVGLSCHLNDWSQGAFQLIRSNVRLNRLEDICTVSCQNANTLLHNQPFDVVDIDPFGSPAPYMDSASWAVRRLLCITATDTAPLCGAHLKSGIRKYAAIPLNTEYHKEMGARILLGAVVRALARRDKGAKMLLTHATRHYIRIYLEIIKGVSAADKTMNEMGFIAHCFNCGYRSWKYGLSSQFETECPNCRQSLNVAGPLWLGSIQEADYCQMVLDELIHRKTYEWTRASRIVALCRTEIHVPTYYEQHWLSKKIKVSPVPIEDLINSLENAGFKASRTHFSGTGFKTDADLNHIYEILKHHDNRT